MAVTSGFFNSINGDRTYNADQMSTYFEGLVSDGIYENIGDRFAVTAATGMTVNVGSGRALIKSHWIKNDAALSVQIDPADVQYGRYDLIVLRLDLNEAGRSITIAVKKGTAAAVPNIPVPTRTNSVYELALAVIFIQKNATSISQSSITDRRSSSQCGWVTGVIKQVDTSDLFLQWQTAYESYYAQSTAAFNAYFAAKQQAFEAWFSTLTQTLSVDTTIVKLQRTTEVTDITTEVTIGIAGYDPSTDILFAYINGLLLVEDDEYTISGAGVTAKIILINSLSGSNSITFIVLKNMIGESVINAGEIVQTANGLTDSSIIGIMEAET